MDQIIIKTLLIVAFLLFAFVLIRSDGSARRQAIRTLALLVFLVAAIITVIFPSIINDLAVNVGIGRGADLLLYGFIVVFLGSSLATTRKRREQDRQITQLARALALQDPKWPAAPSTDSAEGTR